MIIHTDKFNTTIASSTSTILAKIQNLSHHKPTYFLAYKTHPYGPAYIISFLCIFIIVLIGLMGHYAYSSNDKSLYLYEKYRQTIKLDNYDQNDNKNVNEQQNQVEIRIEI